MSLDLTGQAVDNITLSKIDAPIGTYRQSGLTESQFNQVSIGQWVLCDGRDVSGSAYETLTGNSNVPNALTEGTFFRQAKAGRSVGSYESDAIRNITGTFGASRRGTRTATGAFGVTANGNGQPINEANGNIQVDFDASRVVPTADENRPKNIAVNYFIKVNY